MAEEVVKLIEGFHGSSLVEGLRSGPLATIKEEKKVDPLSLSMSDLLQLGKQHNYGLPAGKTHKIKCGCKGLVGEKGLAVLVSACCIDIFCCIPCMKGSKVPHRHKIDKKLNKFATIQDVFDKAITNLKEVKVQCHYCDGPLATAQLFTFYRNAVHFHCSVSCQYADRQKQPN